MYKLIALFAATCILLISSCTDVFKNEQIFDGSTSWVSQASAPSQCMPLTFDSEEAAVNQLKRNGITTFNSKTSVHGVCSACSCPTGIVYHVEILSADTSLAKKADWLVSDEPSTIID